MEAFMLYYYKYALKNVLLQFILNHIHWTHFMYLVQA